MANHTDLEVLLALNREMLALSRAGLPISTELTNAAGSLSGPEAELARRIGDRCTAGQSISDALAAEVPDAPPYYAALIRAGEATGRLPAALESLSEALQTQQRLRHAWQAAIAYPLAVAVLAWALALVGVSQQWPVYSSLGDSSDAGVRGFESSRTLVQGLLLYGVPTVSLLFFFTARSGIGWVKAMPGARKALHLQACASFCRLLGLQVGHGAPLHEALPLTADAIGWTSFDQPARLLGAGLEQGGSLNDLPASRDQLPPLAIPPLAAAEGARFTSAALAIAADHYAANARHAERIAAKLAPVIGATVVGGGSLLGYAAVVLGPYLGALWVLSKP